MIVDEYTKSLLTTDPKGKVILKAILQTLKDEYDDCDFDITDPYLLHRCLGRRDVYRALLSLCDEELNISKVEDE